MTHASWCEANLQISGFKPKPKLGRESAGHTGRLRLPGLTLLPHTGNGEFWSSALRLKLMTNESVQ